MSEENTPETPETPPEKNEEYEPAEMAQQQTSAPDSPDLPDAPDAPAEQTLEQQLADLQKKQADAAVEQVDSTIADLVKLIEERNKAAENYDDDAHTKLQDQEDRLKTERDALSKALHAALGDEGVKEVKQIITEQVKAVSDAEAARDTAKKAADDAQISADDKAADLAAAQTELDVWRKPGDSIGNRLKIAEGLIEDIKKLRNANRRGEAYWKLALGRHAQVPGQEFLNEVLADDPKVIDPDDLPGEILTAWNAFNTARKAAAEAIATLISAQSELKERETDYADKKKNLIKSIADALAEREVSSDAA